MTHAMQEWQEARQITVELADHITASFPALLQSPIRDAAERAEIEARIALVSEPPRREWIMARVVSLLSQYYAADIPQGAVEMMAEDWAEELSQYPEWAINKAVRWWKSGANPDRKRRPVEGDISARARIEMGPVFVAQSAVRRFSQREAAANPANTAGESTE